MKTQFTKRISFFAACIITIVSCQQEHELTPKEEVFVNPYVTSDRTATGARKNPAPAEGGVAENIGPVITPEEGFMVNNEFRFAPGEEFYVDVVHSQNRAVVFFLTGTHIVVGKSNGEAVKADEVIEAFASDGIAYAWGNKDGGPFTWTIGFRTGGINNVVMQEGHVGFPEPVTTTIDHVDPSDLVTNKSAITINFSSNYDQATYNCQLDNGTRVPCTSPMIYENLNDQPHTFQVWASYKGQTDEVGASYSWRVDTTSPFITFISTTTSRSSIQIDWTMSEATTSYLEWGLSPAPENLIPETEDYLSNRSVLLTGLPPATVHYFFIGGKDQAGNTFRSSRFSSATRR